MLNRLYNNELVVLRKLVKTFENQYILKTMHNDFEKQIYSFK